MDELELLHCVGQAVHSLAGEALRDSGPLGDAVYDVAQEASNKWTQHCPDAHERRQEMETLANLTAEESQAQALYAAAKVTQDPVQQEALARYLNQMPRLARRSLSCPENREGRGVPDGMLFDSRNELVPFVPVRQSSLRPKAVIRHGTNAWELLDTVGGGGFGEVWRARLLGSDPECVQALKFCLDQNAESLASLRNEAATLAALGGNWRGIVPLRMACLSEELPFLVYDYISGGDLVRMIFSWHQRPPEKGLIHEAVRLVHYLAKTLQPAHDLADTVVHRDLKPSNILLQPGRRPRHYLPLLCDFGIGSVSSTQAIEHSRSFSYKETTTKSLRGAHSLLYASPQRRKFYENPEDEPDAIPADDVYSLGVIGYQILMGDTKVEPLSGARSNLIARQVPQEVIAVLRSAFATDVANRLPSAGALVAALEKAMPEILE